MSNSIIPAAPPAAPEPEVAPLTIEEEKRAFHTGFITHLTTQGLSEDQVSEKLASYKEQLDKRYDRFDTLRTAVREGFGLTSTPA